jgi:hypothetical protein
MKWFRRHIGAGSRLALFALALQFVLSFGHFHLNTAQPARAIQAQIDLALAQGPAAEKPQPANHDNDQPSNEPCAICAVMSMANQMAFAAPVVLPLPDTIELSFHPTDIAFADPGSRWRAFQSRAPPAS